MNNTHAHPPQARSARHVPPAVPTPTPTAAPGASARLAATGTRRAHRCRSVSAAGPRPPPAWWTPQTSAPAVSVAASATPAVAPVSCLLAWALVEDSPCLNAVVRWPMTHHGPCPTRPSFKAHCPAAQTTCITITGAVVQQPPPESCRHAPCLQCASGIGSARPLPPPDPASFAPPAAPARSTARSARWTLRTAVSNAAANAAANAAGTAKVLYLTF